ncbi:MAG: fibronectin type III domain-containing protein [Methanobacteriota archaeon]
MRVQVSTNGGSTWTTLRQWDSTMPSQTTFAPVSIDLSPYVGGTAKVRFSFDTVDSVANDFLGWLVDDVQVTGSAPPPPPPPPPPPTPPSAPQALAVRHTHKGGGHHLILDWSAPASDGGSPVTAYRVYRGTVSGGEVFLAQVSGSTFTYDDASVAGKVAYFYQVAAVNSAGEGPRSNEVSGTG